MPIHTVATLNGVMGGVNTTTKLRFMEPVTSVADRQSLAQAVRDRWLTPWKTPCAAAMNWISIVVTKEGDPNDSPFMLPINVVGGGATLGVYQACVQWNLMTGQAGRRGRGRIFCPGIHTGVMSLGKLTNAAKLSMDADVATLTGRWCFGGSEQWHLGVLSRLNNALYAVVSLSYNEIFSALRSRKLGVGT